MPLIRLWAMCFISIFCCSPLLSAHRIVSLSPVTTEYLFALGLGKEVVGVTTFCDRPKETKSIAKIGGFIDPQLETILKLKPTLVVGTVFGGARNTIAQLDALGIKTIASPAETLADAKRLLSLIAEATNSNQEALKIQNDFDKAFQALKGSLSFLDKDIVWLVGSSPLVAAGPSTFPGEILNHLGIRNITKGSVDWPILSLEILLSNPPQVIFASEGESALPILQKQLAPLLKKHSSVRIISTNRDILQRPGPYMIEEIRQLISALKKHDA